jgi:hypothetical protein
MSKRIMNNFGQAGLQPASVAQRYWGSAITVGVLAAVVVAFIASVILWRHLPGLPVLQGTLKAHLSGLTCYAIHGLVPFLFPETALDIKNYLRDLSNQGLSHLLFYRLYAAAGAGLLAGGFVGWAVAAPVDGIMHTRGRQLIEGNQAVKSAQALMAAQVKALGADFKIHPGIIFTREQWSKHLIVLGAIGGGKTTIILPILSQIFKRGDKALIFDVKGDFTAKFPTAALVAPWHKGGIAWAIGRDCTTLQDAIGFAEQVVADSKDPMWASAARQVLVGLVVDLQRRKPKRWGWQDLYEQFSRTDEAELELLMQQCNPLGLRAVTSQNQTTSSILINMVAGLQWVASLAQAWGNPMPGAGISFMEWLFDEKTERRQVILQGNGRFEQMMQGYVSSIISMLSARINSPEFKDSRERKLWFVLDEFPQIGKIKYQPLIEVGRSKGVRVVIGLQDINQVVKVYSEQDANSLLSMVGTKIVAQIAPGETAKKMSELIGEREVERLNLSVSGSGSGKSTTTMINRESLKVMYDSELSYELGNRPGKGGVVALMINNDSPFVSMLTWPHDKTPDQRASYDEAEWVNGGVYNDEADFIEIQEEGLLTQERQDGKDRQALERVREQEDEEFKRAVQAQSNARLEQLLGARRDNGAKKKREENATNATARSRGDFFADGATTSGGIGAQQARDGREAQLRHSAEQERQANAITARMPQIKNEEENLAIDGADAMHHGEQLGHALGLGADGQHAIGILSMFPVLADAIRSAEPVKDPAVAAERLRVAQQNRLQREQGRFE